jgi:hypothetical protein
MSDNIDNQQKNQSSQSGSNLDKDSTIKTGQKRDQNQGQNKGTGSQAGQSGSQTDTTGGV